MDDLAQANILDHYKYPRNQGVIERSTATHEEHNPLCGDKVRVDLLVKDGLIEDIRWSGRGCTLSQATTSMLSEELKGQPLEMARAFGKDDVLDLLGIPVGYARLKCALLGLKALKICVYTAGGERWDGDEL